MKRSDQVEARHESSNKDARRLSAQPVITGCAKQGIAHAVRAALRGSRAAAGASAFAVAFTFSLGAAAQTRLADVGGDSADLSEVMVTARREALATADERKKNAETVVDSIVADEAGLLPDNSVTEVLQRVSGVTMVRFGALNDPDHYSAEGSGIQVRGLSSVAARLNGRDVFSANNAGGLSFQDVTPELLAAVDVYKSVTADLIEGGAGGQVDLRTRMPFDFGYGLQAQASAGANYGDLAKKVDGSGSLLLSGRWAAPLATSAPWWILPTASWTRRISSFATSPTTSRISAARITSSPEASTMVLTSPRGPAAVCMQLCSGRRRIP